MKPIIKDYQVDKYNFQGLVLSVFDSKTLCEAHTLRPELCTGELFDFSNETKTFFHESFYAKMNSDWPEFLNAYHLFVKNEIAPLVDEDSFVFQRTPSFRVHLPNNKAVSLWHYDSDTEHKHPPGERNFIIALTDAYGSNAVWAETKPRQKDFVPIEMKHGQYAEFNGNQCTHGNKVNTTGKTRMSFDFRVLPFSKYNPNYEKTTGDIGKRFVIGEYYSLFRNGEITNV